MSETPTKFPMLNMVGTRQAEPKRCRHGVPAPTGGTKRCGAETLEVVFGGNRDHKLTVTICSNCDRKGEWPEEGAP